MPQIGSCPEAANLARFLLGQLSPAQATTLEGHLLDCQRCLSTVSQMEAHDRTARSPRRPPSPEPEAEMVERLIRDLVQLLPNTEPLTRWEGPLATPPGEGSTDDDGDSAPSSLEPTPPLPDPFQTGPYAEPVLVNLVTGPHSVEPPPTVPQAPGGPKKVNIPGYEVLDILGWGGMGIVYKARQKSLNRLVALKMVLAGRHAGPADRARFRAEAEALARLQEPHIVQVHEIGEHQEQLFFSLEFVAGGSLSRRLQGAPQDVGVAARLVQTLARAIHACHRIGIIHRDLKPGNVLLCGGPDLPLEQCLPKISDFGLAKQLDMPTDVTQEGQVLGTPSYMAPEQALARHGEIGPATDIYALGAILYDLLTGRPPFKAATSVDTVQQVIHQDPVPPSRLQPKVPRDLETICLKCLRKEPRQRYATAAALAEDLGRFLASEPIQARSVGAWERGLKWVRRRPGAAALVAVSVLLACSLLACGWIAAFYQSQRANFERQRGADAAARWQEERTKQEHLAGLRAEIQALLQRGQDDLTTGDLQQAQVAFAAAESKAGAESDLEALRAEAVGQLAAVAARQRDHARRDQFLALRDKAFFYQSQFTGLDQLANQEATRATARDALTLFGVSPEKRGSLGLDRTHFNDREASEITAGCYEMLLVLSEAVARPLPAENRREQAEQALRILDRAAELRPPTRAYYLRRGKCLTQLGEDVAAAQEAQHGNALQPESALDHFLLGEEAHQRGEWRQAIIHFQDSLRLQPDHFWARYLCAVCCLRGMRPAEAESHLTACQSQQPGFVWIYLLRGLACGERGKQALVAKRPGEAEAAFASAEADFRKGLEFTTNDEVIYNLLVNRGATRYWHLQYAEAIEDYRAALGRRPEQYQAYVNLAQVYQDLGQTCRAQKQEAEATAQLDQAVGLLDQALKARPQMAGLYRNRAYLHLQRADLPAALHDFEETIRLETPGNAMLAGDHTERGRILQENQRLEEALKAYDAALAIDANHVPAHRYRGTALMALKRYAEAVRCFTVCVDKGPPDADIHEARALARARLQDYRGSLADYSRALEIRPGSTVLHARRGWAYIVDEAPRLALADFEEALRLDPKNADALTGRGYARVKVGQTRDAIADAEQALRLEPPASLVYATARIYAQAAGRAAAETNPQSVRPGPTRVPYQDRALQLIRQALAALPAEQRAPFWRDNVQTDTALAPITRSPEFVQLAASYSRLLK
jgi:tetratricopeptide (TPR) repeat protein/tRNA A-37 threonylcarbamoyl transferase component Bud32